MITVSAPGKLMLLGEHAVVYNRPCLVAAVDRRVTVGVSLCKEKKIKVSASAVGIKNYVIKGSTLRHGKVEPCKELGFLFSSVKLFSQKFGLNTGLNIKIKTDFSCQYGLGSSAAVSAALIKALSKLYKLDLTKKEIFNLAYKAVLQVQGVGSGFDVAAATFGGTLYFLTGGKKIISLEVKELPLVIAYSGVKADTPTIVKNLKIKNQKVDSFGIAKLQFKIQKLFDKIAELVEQARTALLKHDWQKLGMLMNDNHKILQELGVSTGKLDRMCWAALGAGAYGAKLSGAGGGDCMIALVDPKKKDLIEKALIKAGGQILPLNTGATGVRLEGL